MKIAGRIFRTNKIKVNTDKHFEADYKKANIRVYNVDAVKGENPKFFISVTGLNITSVNVVIQRCKIRDAIIYALEESGL
jgi:hypothetical protein